MPKQPTKILWLYQLCYNQITLITLGVYYRQYFRLTKTLSSINSNSSYMHITVVRKNKLYYVHKKDPLYKKDLPIKAFNF